MASKKIASANCVRHQKNSSARSLRHRNESLIEKFSSFFPEEKSEEEKIPNLKPNYEEFLNISQAFEFALNHLEVGGDCEAVYEKLLHIKNLIIKKIFYLENKGIDTASESCTHEKFDMEIKGLDFPGFQSSSSQSLNSEQSEQSKVDNFSDDDSFWQKFLKRVNCPFCSKCEDDKFDLIKHLDENCKPHLQKDFEKINNILPYSMVQILPNNTFKCNVCPNSVVNNIRKYFVHLKTENHVLNFSKAARTKVYSENLFCSCCKTQIPNNFTQLNLHMKHKLHKKMGATTSERNLKKGINCVFSKKNKKFKCLVCPKSQSVCSTPREILQHLEEEKHMTIIRNKKGNLPVIYCEFCRKEVHFFEVIIHFNDAEHKKKEEIFPTEGKMEKMELCLYCGFVCIDLMSLSCHMESKCPVIIDIRKNIMSAKHADENLQERKIEKDVKEGNCIIVKNNVGEIKLLKYFKKFGDVTEIKTYNGKDLRITFREKGVVDDIMSLRNALKIDGVKLEIVTSENDSKPTETFSQGTSSFKSLDGSNKEVTPCTSDEDDNYGTENSNTFEEDYELKNLFEKVSSHLSNNTQKSLSELEKKLTRDVIAILKITECKSVGFFGCELSFPVESVGLYCSINARLFSRESDDENLFKLFYSQICNSDLWENVTTSFCTCFLYINCVHKETRRKCTITFSKYAMVLTNILRDCLKKNDVARSFCLIVRFWLSVHELKIRNSEYTILSLLAFFLINGNIVKLNADEYDFYRMDLLENNIDEKFVIKKTFFKSYGSALNVMGLFREFLKFLYSFDFDKYFICLPFKYPVSKELFLRNRSALGLNESDCSKLVTCSMCILDPIKLRNVAADVDAEVKNSLLKIVRDTIEHYKIK